MASQLAPLHDEAPLLDRLLESSLTLEEKGAAVSRADVLRVQDECLPPVGEGAIDVAVASPSHPPELDQHRIVLSEPEARFGHRHCIRVLISSQISTRKQAMLANVCRRRREPLLVLRYRPLRLAKPSVGADQLIVCLVSGWVELDGALVLGHRLAERMPGVALEEIAVLHEHAGVGCTAQSLFIEPLGLYVNLIGARGLVLLQQFFHGPVSHMQAAV